MSELCPKCGEKMYPLSSFIFNKNLYKDYEVNQTTYENMQEYDGKMICQRCLHELIDTIKKEHFINTGTECIGFPGAFITEKPEWVKEFETIGNN